MKTKIVYVLTSDESDIYLEQNLLSVYSLRKYQPDAVVELVVDDETDQTLNKKRAEILNYVNSKIVVSVPKRFNKIETSRWLKTSLRKHVKGDYLFIDSDTVVTDVLSSIDDFIGDIGAVPDTHVTMGKIPYSSELLTQSKNDGWTYNESLPYFNSGVMFVRDSAKSNELYGKWHEKWIRGVEIGGHVSDQSYLAAANEEMAYVIKEMDGSWNCQIARNGLKYLANASIIHYLGFSFHSQCPPWAFYDRSIFKEIKDNGRVTPRIDRMVDDSKTAFPLINGIVAGNEIIIVRSRLFRLLLRYLWIVKAFERLSRIVFR